MLLLPRHSRAGGDVGLASGAFSSPSDAACVDSSDDVAGAAAALQPPTSALSSPPPPRLGVRSHRREGAPEEQDRRGHHDQGGLHRHCGHHGRRGCDSLLGFTRREMPANHNGVRRFGRASFFSPRPRPLLSLSSLHKKTALDLLVSKRITGLPVVDSEGLVVSSFDFCFLRGEEEEEEEYGISAPSLEKNKQMKNT